MSKKLLIIFLFAIPISWCQIYNSDIWFHMQTGRALISSFDPIDFSTWYFSPVNAAITDIRYTFLGDIFLYLVYLLTGPIGLQVIRIMAVLLTCWLLWRMSDKSWFFTLLLMILIVGTYQKQIVRNSLFELLLTALFFYLFYRFKQTGRYINIIFYPAIMGIWSCLHGSFLIGIGLLALMFAGDSIDKFNFKKLAVYVLILGTSYSIVTFKNPVAQSYLNTDFVASTVTSNQPSVSRTMSIAERLNNTIWKNKGPLRSSDFVSPFEKLSRVYVWVCLISFAIGIWIALTSQIPMSSVFVFVALSVFGLGYLRAIGYIPIATCFIYCMSKGYLWNKSLSA